MAAQKKLPYLSRNIIAAREAAGMTRYRLAVKADVDHASLSRIESGQRTNPAWSTVVRLARALGISLDALAQTFDK